MRSGQYIPFPINTKEYGGLCRGYGEWDLDRTGVGLLRPLSDAETLSGLGLRGCPRPQS